MELILLQLKTNSLALQPLTTFQLESRRHDANDKRSWFKSKRSRTTNGDDFPQDRYFQPPRFRFSYELDQETRINASKKRKKRSKSEASTLLENGCPLRCDDPIALQSDRSKSLDFGPAFDFTGSAFSASSKKRKSDRGFDFRDNHQLDPPEYRTIFSYSNITEQPVYPHGASDAYQQIVQPDDFIESQQSGVVAGPSFYARLLHVFSLIVLLLGLPVLGWIFVKHLNTDQRLLVFRLGRRQKIKGPGWVILLPFCDRWRSLKLGDQTTQLLSVCGPTCDEALVEVSFKVTYRLSDDNADLIHLTAGNRAKPDRLLSQSAKLALLACLGRTPCGRLTFSFNQKSDVIGLAKAGGDARSEGDEDLCPELANEVKNSLNLELGRLAISVVQVSILKLTLERECPPAKERADLSTVGRQLQLLSSLFKPSSTNSTNPRPTPNGSLVSDLLMQSKHNGPATSHQPPLDSVTTVIRREEETPSTSQSTVTSSSVGSSCEGNVNGGSSGGHFHHHTSISVIDEKTGCQCPGETKAERIRLVKNACEQLLDRASRFLNNTTVCLALGRKLLVVVVIGTESSSSCDRHRWNEQVVDGNDVEQLLDRCPDTRLVRLDARTGQAAIGVASDSSKAADATLCIGSSDLIKVLDGQVNIVHLLNSNKARLHGDRSTFEKMRHLIYLAPK